MAQWLGFFLVPKGYVSTPEASEAGKQTRTRTRGVNPWFAASRIVGRQPGAKRSGAWDRRRFNRAPDDRADSAPSPFQGSWRFGESTQGSAAGRPAAASRLHPGLQSGAASRLQEQVVESNVR